MRRLLGAGVCAVTMAGGLAVGLASSADAAPQNVTGGSLTWGVKESFRNYITGFAAGEITTGGGATQAASNGVFTFPAATSSTFDPEAGTSTASFGGSVHFVGHEGILDVLVSNIRIERTGATGNLIADVVSKQFISFTQAGPSVTYTDVVLASLSGGTASADTSSASWTGATSTLTTAGVPAFGTFYTAGSAFDPVSYTIALAPPATTTTAAPTTTTTAGGTTTTAAGGTTTTTAGGTTTTAGPTVPAFVDNTLVWRLSEQAWASSSLNALPAAQKVGAPATIDANSRWNFPAAPAASYNPANGALKVQYTGFLQVGNVNQGGYKIQLANPLIEVDADGNGTVKAAISYCAGTQGNSNPSCTTQGMTTPSAPTVIAKFTLADSAVTLTGNTVSFSAVPNYPTRPAPNEAFGQWEQSFLDVLAPATPSLLAHFQGTSAANNGPKAPAPLAVSFAASNIAAQTINTEVLADGGLTISVAGSVVNLPTPMLNADGSALVTSGAMHNVTVADLRLSNAGWNVRGQVTDFTATGGTIAGNFLGWTPGLVSATAGQNVTPGPVVTGGPTATSGLKASQLLGSSPAGTSRGTAVLKADLELRAPTNTPAGSYSATLTLTVI